MNITRLVLPVALTVAVGCADSDDPLRIDGTYRVQTTLQNPRGITDLESPNFAAFVDLADHPDRVGAWLLELLDNELEPPYSTALRLVTHGADADTRLTQFLMDRSPETINDLISIAASLRSVTQELRLRSELEIVEPREKFESPDNDEIRLGDARHQIQGVTFSVRGRDVDYDFSEMRISMPRWAEVEYQTRNDHWMSFREQRWDLAYGEIMDFALNEIIVDEFQPFADDFGEVVARTIPCPEVGGWVGDQIGLGDFDLFDLAEDAFGTACAFAVREVVSRFIPIDLYAINTILSLQGDAKLIDSDGNGKVEELVDGEWEGDMEFPARMVRLRRPEHIFRAERERSFRFDD